jgi:hypothetical protein
MANASLLHNLMPFVLIIGVAVLLKAWLGGRPSGPTLDVRPAPLMTNVERRTIAYIESALPRARVRYRALVDVQPDILHCTARRSPPCKGSRRPARRDLATAY